MTGLLLSTPEEDTFKDVRQAILAPSVLEDVFCLGKKKKKAPKSK